MLELGTPMHAFDASKVSSIQIGNAKDQEDFITLDGTKRTLNKEDFKDGVALIKRGKKNFNKIIIE